jgi:ATP-dependent Clp protease adaptor protein ClpS
MAQRVAASVVAMPNYKHEHDEAVVTESKQKVKKPPLYKVLLHNDDYTTMDFVVFVLRTVFRHSEHDAIRIMFQVHNQGLGVAGVFTYEVAEAKVARVMSLAREHEFPLLCSMQEE